MANTFLMSLNRFCIPLGKNAYKMNSLLLTQQNRFLYAKATLGLDTFAQQKQVIQNQMGNIAEKFKEKMGIYVEDNAKNMIFTEDLKNMLHLAESDDDINLVVKMMKKFNQQNKQLRFGNFVFGPVVMRLFHMYNKPDLALECFLSSELDGFFDQLITYQILLDLLYENAKYEDILKAFEAIKDRQIEGTKFPKNVVVLVMAALYKINTKESLDHALKIWHELAEAGHAPMRRATTFSAGLAVNQGKPDAALEMLATVKNLHYTTVRNLKVLALADVGRVEDIIPILKSVITNDHPGGIAQTFNRDVIERAKAAVETLNNPDVTLEFTRIVTLFEKEGHISDMSLDEHLCSEIQRPPVMNNREPNRYSRFDRNNQGRNVYNRFQQRPGLRDLV